MAKKIAIWVVLVVLAFAAAGCHTLSGVGKDLQDATSKYTDRR